MEVVNEYWIFLDNTDILGVFQTLQECFLWKPAGPVSNPKILRVKQLMDGSFKKQVIAVNADLYR